MAGIYALAGAAAAYKLFYTGTNPGLYTGISGQELTEDIFYLLLLAVIVLILAVGTAAYLSHKKARKNKEAPWNPVARRMVFSMAIPLLTGGVLILILLFKGLIGITASLTLIFYGLALINASKFTFKELKSLGLIEILLGLISSYFIGYALMFWAVGFGLMHIAYGIYMHLKYKD